jgi:hypothetical protein
MTKSIQKAIKTGLNSFIMYKDSYGYTSEKSKELAVEDTMKLISIVLDESEKCGNEIRNIFAKFNGRP